MIYIIKSQIFEVEYTELDSRMYIIEWQNIHNKLEDIRIQVEYQIEYIQQNLNIKGRVYRTNFFDIHNKMVGIYGRINGNKQQNIQNRMVEYTDTEK